MVLCSAQRENIQEELRLGVEAHRKHLEDQVRNDVLDITFRVPCPVDEKAANFEHERSVWVTWMNDLGFDLPTLTHPNICCGDLVLVCFIFL